MKTDLSEISKRKTDHIQICLDDKSLFNQKTSGFENYDFIHNAIPDFNFDSIDVSTYFNGQKINYPFMISCMTGGTIEAESINAKLANAGNFLNIPVGLGSFRPILENIDLINSYNIIRKNAPNVPILANIGIAQVIEFQNDFDKFKLICEKVGADILVVHFNPAQELFQKNGDLNFKNALNSLTKLVKKIKLPIFAKETGAGIEKNSAIKLLEIGIKGIDVAGAGGTSWTSVEIIRNENSTNSFFANWGNPTTYCINSVKKLKKEFDFTLISSGGIKSGEDIAKSIALGADLTASARVLLNQAVNKGEEGVIEIIQNWFETVKKIMFLTGAKNIKSLKTLKLINKKDFY